jgi:nitrogen fixation NifU-like protein
MKALYYGDNLQVLRDSIATESVDLIYREFPVRVKCATLAWHTMHAAMSGNAVISTE